MLSLPKHSMSSYLFKISSETSKLIISVLCHADVILFAAVVSGLVIFNPQLSTVFLPINIFEII
jgi:hypothetical protein